MRTLHRLALVGVAAIFYPALADAHVTVISSPNFANTSQELTFGVAHGCAGADTSSVRIEIPAGVTSVRPEPSDFGPVTIEKDNTDTITAVSWTKPAASVLPSDVLYYKLTVRVKFPDKAFQTVSFLAHQTCTAGDGGIASEDWIQDGGANPAPVVNLVPARSPGWNKYTVPAAIPDLSVFFGDAVIVWKGNAAYSANAQTAAQITSTAGVTPLTSLSANDEVWVKY